MARSTIDRTLGTSGSGRQREEAGDSMTDRRLPIRFETERLVLRRYRESDAPTYYAMSLRNREHLREYESDNVAMTLESEAHTAETLRDLVAAWRSGSCYFIGGFDRSTGEFVAQVYVGPFDELPHEFILGYIVDREHEGRGYVTEAVRATVRLLFDELDAHRVRIHCADTNLRSIRVAERCGFEKEGHIHEAGARPGDGAPGTLIYGIVRSEYDTGRLDDGRGG